jgi:hypothetical protein
VFGDAAEQLLRTHAHRCGYLLTEGRASGDVSREWRDWVSVNRDALDGYATADRQYMVDTYRKTGTVLDTAGRPIPGGVSALRSKIGVRTREDGRDGDVTRVRCAVVDAPNTRAGWAAGLREITRIVGVPVEAPIPACPDLGLVDLARAAVEDAQAAEDEARRARETRRAALRELLDHGFSLAEVATMIGVSRQRVAQLVK